MKVRKHLLSLLPLAALAGCASVYQAKSVQNPAWFSVAAQNDSTSTTVRGTYAWAFGDENCSPNKHGTRLGSDTGNSASSASTPVPIVAGEKFVFTAVYVEARFAQNRQCAVTASFLPVPGRRYQARIVSSQQVNACQLGVYDVTGNGEQRVDFSMPPHACMYGSSTREANGRPLWTHWEFRVNTIPAK